MIVSLTTRERVRASVPWWVKGALKLTFAKLPVGYSALKWLSLARHGGMERPDFAYDAFRRHFDNVDFRRKSGGFTALELGPGDSLFMALIAKRHGASDILHVDVGPFATAEISRYRQMAAYLAERGLKTPDLSASRSIGDVLTACSSRYETAGLASLRAIPDGSIDFAFSNGVLQSVWRNELPATLRELRRVLHPQGASIHSVDLRDTMGMSLNHLRFSERVWESDWFRKAGFYTNRLRVSELAAVCRRAGFEVELDEVNRWNGLPVRRKALARPYRDMPDDELLTKTIRVILRPAANGGGGRNVRRVVGPTGGSPGGSRIRDGVKANVGPVCRPRTEPADDGMSESVRTVGVLYPGEMGAALASLLGGRGHRIVTTLAGRGGARWPGAARRAWACWSRLLTWCAKRRWCSP